MQFYSEGKTSNLHLSMSLSTCVAHFNSMLTATFPLRLVKMMGKGMREGDCGNTDAGKEGEDRSSIAECP